MLLFSVEERVVYAQNPDADRNRTCKCGKQAQQVTIITYLTFLSLPLILFRCELAYKCFACFRLNNTKIKQLNPAKYETRFPLFFGWVIMFALLGAILFTYKQVFPEDEELRLYPKVGDLYILNAYKVENKDEFSRHPYVLARVIEIDDSDSITVVLSKWFYRKEISVIRDLLTRKEQLNSYYSSDFLTISRAQLQDRAIVLSARRRVKLVDMERIHKRTGLETDVQRYPTSG